MRMLDLFCGRLGWSKAFLARGWDCVGYDLVPPPEIPEHFSFHKVDVLMLDRVRRFDFICASPPCEQFSKFGLRCFYPDPPHPELGIKLFIHTRAICQMSGIPYVIENVRAAQQFVGRATHHCGPFYLWGTGVPALMNQGIKKGLQLGKSGFAGREQREFRKQLSNPSRDAWSGSAKRAEATAEVATIPPELANCVADYAERLLEAKF